MEDFECNAQLQKFSDDDLLTHLETIAASERKLYAEVIEALEEIERRKLYLARGYASLFSFCTEFLKYSAGAAQRRIESMRLVKNFARPEKAKLKEKLESGAVHLTHLSLVAKAIRSMPERPSNHEKMQLIEKVENTTSEQCEKTLIEVGAAESFKRESFRRINSEAFRLSISLDEKTCANLEHFIALTAHQNPWASREKAVAMAIELALVAVMKKKGLESGDRNGDGDRNGVSAESGKETHERAKSASLPEITSATEVIAGSIPPRAQRSRAIPSAIKREVWRRDHGKCQHKDPHTKRPCDSRFALELDHIREFARGGGHEARNLRLYCASHNRGRGKIGDASSLRLSAFQAEIGWASLD